MSIEGENRELLFQELYNMVGYHLAQHGQMPRLLFDDENPKSSDPTKHVVYNESEGKIVIHTGRFKMTEAKIKERLREGFKCDIGVDGQEESVEIDFTPTPQNKNSIKAEGLNGYLTCGKMVQMSQDRREKYYTEKKAPLKDRNPEDDNKRLEEQFNNIPNKGPEANNNSVQNIMNKFGNNGGPQQLGSQPSGQQLKRDTWLTDYIPHNANVQKQGIDKLLGGVNPQTQQPFRPIDAVAAIVDQSSRWGRDDLEETTLKSAAVGGALVGRLGGFNNNNLDHLPLGDNLGAPADIYDQGQLYLNNAAANTRMDRTFAEGYNPLQNNGGGFLGVGGS